MTRSLAEILDDGDDARLCRDLAEFLFPERVRRRNLRSLPRAQRVIRLVWDASRVMDSGGLRELLCRGVPGDRNLKLTVRAHEIIGCEPATTILRDALAHCPEGKLPRDEAVRVQLVESRSAELAGLLQNYQAVQGELVRSLAQYARRNRDALLTGTRKKRARRLGTPRELPHWARVLFAARCAKIVCPLLKIHWPNMTGKRKLAVKRAIHVAAKSALRGAPHDRTAEAVALAEQTASAAHGGTSPEDIEPRAKSGISRTIASFVAKAAEKAAFSAQLPPEESMPAVEDSFRFAQSAAVASGSSVLMRKLKHAFSKLHLMSAANGWTDETAIDRQVWEAL